MQEAKIKITADSKDADSQIKKFSASFKSSMKDIEDVAKKAAVGIAAISGAIGVAVSEYSQGEKAVFKLQAALTANGRQVDKTMKSYIDFAAEIQGLTVVGDETTLKLLQTAESMGLTGEAALRAAKNAIAMQGAFDIGAEGAIRMTVALEQGESEMLRRYIPALKNIDNDTQRAAAAQDILAKAFDVARAEANTFGGSITQLKNAFGDTLEIVGEPFAKDLNVAAKSLKEFFTTLQTNPIFIENIEKARNVLKEFFLFIYDNQKILAGLAGAYLILGTAVVKYSAAVSLAIIGVERLTRAEANFRLLLKLPEKAAIAQNYNRLSSAVEETSTKLDELKNRYRELRALPELSMSEKIEVQILQTRIKTFTASLSSYQEKLKEVGEKVREIDSLELAKLAGDAQGPLEKSILELVNSISKLGNIEIPKIKDEKMLEEIKATGTAAAKKFQEGFVFYEDFESVDNFIFSVVNKFEELNKISAIGIDSESIISDTTKSEVLAAIEILQLYKEQGIEVNQSLVDSIVESVRKGREEISNFAMESIIDNDFLTNLQAAEEKYMGESVNYFEKANQEKLANQQKFFTALTSATSSRYKTLFNVIKVAEASIGLINAYGAAVKALNDPTPLSFWARLANYAAILGAGLNLVNAINSASMGGSAGGDIGASGGGSSSGNNNLSTLETGNNQRQSNITIEFNVGGSIVSGEKENFQQLVRDTIIPLLQDEANIRVGGLGIA